MQIRLATASDLKNCLALDSSYETDHVWQVYTHADGDRMEITIHSTRLPRSVTMNAVMDNAKWMRVNWERHECFLVAEHQGHVLGFVDVTTQAWQQAAWINNLVVGRDFRRRGLGKALMSAARMWAQQKDLRVLMLETQPKNYPAIVFYQRLGFNFCGYNDQYYDNDDIALFFACRLR
jgi:ribosomal protein S18 acetylase RimI-like enzyme